MECISREDGAYSLWLSIGNVKGSSMWLRYILQLCGQRDGGATVEGTPEDEITQELVLFVRSHYGPTRPKHFNVKLKSIPEF